MAVSTEQAEVAQAFFCAVADGVGLSVINKNFGPKLQTKGGKVSNPLNGTLFRTVTEAKNAEESDTFEEFEKRWNAWRKNHSVSAGAIPLKQIYKEHVKSHPLLNYDTLATALRADDKWYRSSRNIAVAMLRQIDKVVGPEWSGLQEPGWTGEWKDILYLRETGVMTDIRDLFNIANGKRSAVATTVLTDVMLPFTNINKWTTADIYFVTTKGTTAIKELLKKSIESPILFPELNKNIRELVESGNLLPLSLKKNLTGQVHIYKINFVESARAAAIIDKVYTPNTKPSYAGKKHTKNFKDWAANASDDADDDDEAEVRVGVDRKLMKNGSWPTGIDAKHYSRSLYLEVDKNTGLRLQIRHDPSRAGEIKVELKIPKGGEARGGGMNIGVLEEIIRFVDPEAELGKKNTGIEKQSTDLRQNYLNAKLYSAGSGTGCFGAVKEIEIEVKTASLSSTKGKLKQKKNSKTTERLAVKKGTLTVKEGQDLWKTGSDTSFGKVPPTPIVKKNASGVSVKAQRDYQLKQRDSEYAELSAHYVTDPLFKKLNNYIIALEKTEEGLAKLTNMVRLMYMFTSAQSIDSSPYVLAK